MLGSGIKEDWEKHVKKIKYSQRVLLNDYDISGYPTSRRFAEAYKLWINNLYERFAVKSNDWSKEKRRKHYWDLGVKMSNEVNTATFIIGGMKKNFDKLSRVKRISVDNICGNIGGRFRELCHKAIEKERRKVQERWEEILSLPTVGTFSIKHYNRIAYKEHLDEDIAPHLLEDRLKEQVKKVYRMEWDKLKKWETSLKDREAKVEIIIKGLDDLKKKAEVEAMRIAEKAVEEKEIELKELKNKKNQVEKEVESILEQMNVEKDATLEKVKAISREAREKAAIEADRIINEAIDKAESVLHEASQVREKSEREASEYLSEKNNEVDGMITDIKQRVTQDVIDSSKEIIEEEVRRRVSDTLRAYGLEI